MTPTACFMLALTLAEFGKWFVIGVAVCAGWALMLACARDLFR